MSGQKEIKILKATLTFNRHIYTEALKTEVEDLLIVDASKPGSKYKGKGNVMRIENEGFTRNWIKVFNHFEDSDYTHIWMMNNDIRLRKYSDSKVFEILEEYENCATLTPSFNSAYKHLYKQTNKENVRTVSVVEFTAPFVNLQYYKELGGFNPVYTLGWGVEMEYCYKARKAGLLNLVSDQMEFHHIGSDTIKTQTDAKKYRNEATKELTENLRLNLGDDWRELLRKGYEQEHKNYFF